jgi:hypothetical protein
MSSCTLSIIGISNFIKIMHAHLSSRPVFSGVRVTRSLVLYVCFVDRCLSFCPFSFELFYNLIEWVSEGGREGVSVLFLLAIALSDLLRFTDSNYPFCIFKYFLFNTKYQLLSYIMARKSYIQWNDDDVHFVLDQHA